MNEGNMKWFHKSVFLIFVICMDIVIGFPEYFMEKHCSQTLALNIGSVEAVKLKLVAGQSYPNNARCAMRIQAPVGKRLQIKIDQFDVRGSPETQCNTGDFISFLDGPGEQSPPLSGVPRRMCSRPVGSDLASSDRFVVVQFASDNDMVVGKGMTLVITAFTDGPCSESQFQCRSNRRCIQKQLECDGTPNCADGSDEAMPKCMSTAAIAGIAVGGGIVLIAAIVIFVMVIVSYIRRRRARTIRRALVSQNSGNTLWHTAHRMASRKNGLDATKIDPVWTGVDDNKDKIDKDKVDVANGTHNMLSETDAEIRPQLIERTVSIRGPNGETMTKVPSGYWEIPLSEIYDYAEDDTPTTEV